MRYVYKATITFPISFTENVYQAFNTVGGSDWPSTYNCTNNRIDETSFAVGIGRNQKTGEAPYCQWIAIGY